MLNDINYSDTLPKVCLLSLSMDTQQNCRGAGRRSIYCFMCSFLSHLLTTAICHILFFHRIYMTALVYLIHMTLPNSHYSIQDAPALPPSPSDPPMESAASLLTSATLQDLCAPPALYSAPIFSCAH